MGIPDTSVKTPDHFHLSRFDCRRDAQQSQQISLAESNFVSELTSFFFPSSSSFIAVCCSAAPSKMMRYGRSGGPNDFVEEDDDVGDDDDENVVFSPREQREALERFLVRPGKRGDGDIAGNFMARASKRGGGVVADFLARPGKRGDFGGNFMARASKKRSADVASFLSRPGKKRNFGDHFMARASRAADVNSFLTRPGKRGQGILVRAHDRRPDHLIGWPWKRAPFGEYFMARASRSPRDDDYVSSFLARPGKKNFGAGNFMARASRGGGGGGGHDVLVGGEWPGGKRNTVEFLARPGKRGVVRIVRKRGVVRIVKKENADRYVRPSSTARRRIMLKNLVKKLAARARRKKQAAADFDSDLLMLRVIKRAFGDNFMARASRSGSGDDDNEQLGQFLTRPGRRNVADFLARPGKRGGGGEEGESGVGMTR